MEADKIFFQISSCVEPGLRLHRRHKRGLIEIACLRRGRIRGDRPNLFGIPLLNHPEAPELALNAIEVAVMVGITRDKAVAADAVIRLHPLDYMHRERQPGDPRTAAQLVLQVKPRRGSIMNPCFRSHIVFRLNQQVRFLPTHQVYIIHRLAGVLWQRR